MPRPAKIPVINSPTITLGERVGQDKHRSALWRLHCQCGEFFDVAASRIREGWYRCPNCDPKPSDCQPQAVLGAMPGTYAELVERTGLSRNIIKHRLVELRDEKNRQCYIGRWARCKENGNPVPVFCVGNKPDVPRPPAQGCAKYSRRYRKNIATAIQKAREGKKYKDQYAGHVALALASDVAARTRVNPQHWFSALGL